MKHLLILFITVALSLLVVIELGLRSLFGFGNPLLYIKDDHIGYLLAPNQNTRRFGNRIVINQYSMRSDTIQKQPSPYTKRILLLGDSIANGGWWTDQDKTISALLKNYLASQTHTGNIEVLNASANSWSPRNEWAYLEKFGTFEAQIVVLLINTDDLFGTKPTSLAVGRDRNYPEHKPFLALIEVCQRYLIKPPVIPELEMLNNEAGDRVGIILEAIANINRITTENHGKLILGITPLQREISSGSRDYEIIARARLQGFTKDNNIAYIDFLPILKKQIKPESFYHDHIHFNFTGNRLISQEIEKILLEKFNFL